MKIIIQSLLRNSLVNEYLVSCQVDRDEAMSVVVINNPRGAHLGHYLCTANNTQGRDARTLHLKGKEDELRFLVKTSSELL